MLTSVRGLLKKKFTLSLLLLVAVFAALLIFALHPLRAQTADVPKDDNSLLDAYRHVEVASVSDALEQVTGKKMYMSHRMRPIFPSKFAGIALTVRLKEEENDDPTALNGMLSAIDARTEKFRLGHGCGQRRRHRRHGRPDGHGDVCAKLCGGGDRWRRS